MLIAAYAAAAATLIPYMLLADFRQPYYCRCRGCCRHDIDLLIFPLLFRHMPPLPCYATLLPHAAAYALMLLRHMPWRAAMPLDMP